MTDQDSAPSAADVPGQAAISSVEQLKALADPTRLAILDRLMITSPGLPVMSVKELAEALAEPQTKLYRHVKVLESAGLIRVAATRLVSGIAEQRYQACQRDLEFAAGLLGQHVDETEAMALAMFDSFRNGFVAAYRASHSPPADSAPPGHATMVLTESGLRTPAQIAAVREKLAEARACFNEGTGEEPDAVQVNLLAAYFIQGDSE